MWELELLTVAISRVHKLRDNFIVGTKSEARAALKILLNIANPNAKKIADRLNMLNVLNTNNEVGTNVIFDNKIYLTMIDVTHTPPMHGFTCLSISRANPHKTHFSTTTKRLEKQIRDDNNGKGDISLCDEVWEIACFVHDFQNDNERVGRFKDLKHKMECKKGDNFYKSPWKLNERLKEYVKIKTHSSMKFVQCCHMKKSSIQQYCDANDIVLC